jgi:hypothetical protein
LDTAARGTVKEKQAAKTARAPVSPGPVTSFEPGAPLRGQLHRVVHDPSQAEQHEHVDHQP